MDGEALSRILVVEDDPDILAVIRLSLEMDGGYTVAACSLAAEALVLALSFGPDMLLLDMMLPDQDGRQLLEALRREAATAATPAVFLTARTRDEGEGLTRLPGVLGIIPKPFDPLRLSGELRRLWTRRPGADGGEGA